MSELGVTVLCLLNTCTCNGYCYEVNYSGKYSLQVNRHVEYSLSNLEIQYITSGRHED